MDTGRQEQIELTLLYVVEASITAKWFLGGEPFEKNAIMLKDDFLSGFAEFVGLFNGLNCCGFSKTSLTFLAPAMV